MLLEEQQPNNDLQIFEDFKQVVEAKKQAVAKEKQLKEELLELMIENDVKKIDNEYVTVTRVDESKTVKLDWNKVKTEEPGTYEDLLSDYSKVTLDTKRVEDEEPGTYESLKEDFPKVSKRKAHVRVKVN